MKSKLLKILALLLFIIVCIVIFKWKTIKRLYNTIHLFDEAVIINNFQNMDQIYSVSRLQASEKPFKFPRKEAYQLPESFFFKNREYRIDDYFKNTNTEGFLVIHRDTLIFEEYYNGLTESTTHISWSVAKSFIATLLGIAYHDGLFDLEKAITDYVPQLKNTGYDGVKIKDILQMSSGVGFNEDYGDFNSDINRFGRTVATGSSLEAFCKSLKREREPGTYCHYVSIDTQVLGMLLSEVTGQSITDYLETKLWKPMGMEYPAEWLIDDTGFELALGGLNATLRDYGKLGQLYLHNGYFNGQQIVPASWVAAAVTPDAPHLMPGEHEFSSHPYGYGYQWWIPENDEDAFFASGIYNQYIYVKPRKNLVIVKLSANHHFKQEGSVTKDIHMALFKSLAADFPEVATAEKEEEE